MAKNSITLFFYINLYLTFLRSCCENIFKIVFIVSEKIGKYISEFAILFLTLIRSSLQFHWNQKYFSSAILNYVANCLWLRAMVSICLICLMRKGKLGLIPGRGTSHWLAHFSSIPAAICLLLKIFCQDKKSFILKSFSSFPTSHSSWSISEFLLLECNLLSQPFS